MIRLNPPHSIATAKGHLDRVRQGIGSTKPVPPGIPPPSLPFLSDSLSPELDSLDCADPPQSLEIDDEDEHVFTKLVSSDEASHSDLTGKFPLTSRRGFSYILISVWRGYIHADLLKSRSAADYVKAYDAALTFFKDKGNVRISLQRLDNETSGALDSFLRSRVDSVEYVPPHSHRANRAERAIRTFKNHLVSCLSTTDTSFPLYIWDEILPQCELTLNHLQPFSLNPSISAYEGLHRAPFDFSSHPIAPCGTRVLVYESPSTRKTWAPHGVKGYYLGPSLSHHRVFRTWISSTNHVRDTDTLAWFPEAFKMPGSSPTELVEAALRDLQAATLLLSNSSSVPHDQRQLVVDQTMTATQAVQAIISAYGAPHMFPTHLPPAQEQRVPVPAIFSPSDPASEQRVPSGPSISLAPPTLSVPPPPPCPPVSTHSMRLRSAALSAEQRIPLPKIRRLKKKAPRPSDLSRLQASVTGPNVLLSPPSSFTHPSSLPSHSHGLSTHVSDNLTSLMANALRVLPSPILSHSSASSHSVSSSMCSKLLSHIASIHSQSSPSNDLCAFAGSVLNIDESGNPLTYSSAMSGPNREHWQQAEFEELVRLVETKTLRAIHPHDQPSDRVGDTTYYSPQVKEKMKDGVKMYRIRGTAGGDRINYPGEVSARTAELTVVKVLLNATVSENAHFATADIKDFYLGTPLERPEYIRLPIKFLPSKFLDLYSLQPFIHNCSILFSI